MSNEEKINGQDEAGNTFETTEDGNVNTGAEKTEENITAGAGTDIPYKENSDNESTIADSPSADNHSADNPSADNPSADSPSADNPSDGDAASGQPQIKPDNTKWNVTIVIAAALLIVLVLTGIYFATRPASMPEPGDTTLNETTGAPETEAPEILPDSAYGYTFEKTDNNGKYAGKNIVVIQIPNLSGGIIGASYNGVEITPNINALLPDSAYFKNNISSVKDVTSLDFVLNNSLYAPEYDSALLSVSDMKLNGLTQILTSQGYKAYSFTYGDENAYGGKPAWDAMGYTTHKSLSVDSIGSGSVYSAALTSLKKEESPYYAIITGINTLYPFYNADKGTINETKIGTSAAVASYVGALSYEDKLIGEFIQGLTDAGVYDNTVIVITGTGTAFDVSDAQAVKGMTELCGSYTIQDYIKTPLLLCLPGFEGREYDNLTSHIDFMPTMLDLLGINGDNTFCVGSNLFTVNREELYIQSALLRGSFINADRVVSADETAVGRLSSSYNFVTGKTGSAATSDAIIKKSVAYFKDYDKAIVSGIISDAMINGRRAAVKNFEENKESMPEVISYSTADIFPSNESDDFYKSDVKLFNKAKMIYSNEMKGTFISLMFKNDGIMLTPGSTAGTFISEDISLGGSFDTMIASWNTNTSGGTVEISVQAKKSDGSYTEWFSWGKWSQLPGLSGSVSAENADGKIDIDTLILTEKCSGTVRIRAELRMTGDKSPVLYNVTLATNKAAGTLKAPNSTEKKLTVNRRYQLDVPEIGGRICSPTSLSMVLDYYGEPDFDTAQTAAGVLDNTENIYGNWSYNVAYAGELGYNAYLDYYDTDALKYAVSKNVPVVCSIKVTKGQLTGSGLPDYSTSGHLLTVIGYTSKDGKDWFIINDPAQAQVETKMLVSEFETIWRGTVYIVQKHPERFTWRIGEGTDRDILIVADYIPEGRYNRPGGSYKPRYIVIHNTGNFTASADALAHRNYILAAGTETSWHYTVDDTTIYKHLPEGEKAWHAGDGGNGKGNTYGIGIEICVNHDSNGTTRPSKYFRQACSNTTQLVAELMYKYNLKISAVQQHNYFSGKNCPQVIRENDMWDAFLDEVQIRYDAIVAERGAKN